MHQKRPAQCNLCGESCDLKETIYKIKHAGKLYSFCSEECKKKFQKEHFEQVIY